MQVDAVEQRAGEARLIVDGAARRTAAAHHRIVEMAAAAGVHRRDELHPGRIGHVTVGARDRGMARSEEHTSELQSLMRNSYAVLCLKKKNKTTTTLKQA